MKVDSDVTQFDMWMENMDRFTKIHSAKKKAEEKKRLEEELKEKELEQKFLATIGSK